MAQIDFTNAQLELQSFSSNYGIISQKYLWLYNEAWYDPVGNIINKTTTVVENTPTKYSVRYQGTIPNGPASSSFISIAHYAIVVYKITGITYSPGDTFDCTIEVELTPS